MSQPPASANTPAFSLQLGGTGALPVWAFLGWVMLSLMLVALFVLRPIIVADSAKGIRLGTDWPMEVFKDTDGSFTADAVAALPDAAFTPSHTALSQGYTRTVYWHKIAAPPLEPRSALVPDDPLWLEILPPYLDRVTLYQRDGQQWHEIRSGDTVPMAERLSVRQLAFPLMEGQPLLLRVQTSSPMQWHGTVWRSSDWLVQLSAVEWVAGLYQGLSLTLVLLLVGAAMMLRMRSLAAVATAAFASFIHGAADNGYLQIWLPSSLTHWGDTAVSVGTLALPAALSWQVRELLTRHTAWRRVDRLLLLVGLAPLLCLVSLPLGRYSDWAWVGIIAPWVIAALWAVVAWSNLKRQGPTLVNTLMVTPSTIVSLLGVYVVAVYMGWTVSPTIETNMLWQVATLAINVLVTLAVASELVQKFRASMQQQSRLVAQLERSEQALEDRVRQRTGELLQAQNSLQLALHREKELSHEQRRFFDVVNHELRTPLAVIDSAAMEQIAFPSSELEPQLERATQIRRACRRLTTLVDNCLVNDRLEAHDLRLQITQVALASLIRQAVQLVRWSPRYTLKLDTAGAPHTWNCDAMLMPVAINNLVDHAVKHAAPGHIGLRVCANEVDGLAVTMDYRGSALPPEVVQNLCEDASASAPLQPAGFSTGLALVKRIARLHGGDCHLDHTAQGTTRLRLQIPHAEP